MRAKSSACTVCNVIELISPPCVGLLLCCSWLGVSCIGIGSSLGVTLTSAFLFLHEALYETSDQLLVAADLPSFPTSRGVDPVLKVGGRGTNLYIHIYVCI